MFFKATKDNWQSCPKYKSFFKKKIIFNFHFQCWSFSEENGIFFYLNQDSFFCSLLCWGFWWALLKTLQEYNNSMSKIFRSHSLYCTIYLSYYGKCAKFELKFQKSLFPSFHSCWLWRWVLTWKSSLSTRELLKNSM